MRLPIRHRLGHSDEETAHRSTDVPGLLFFYLFADELTTYSLMARREHHYAGALNALRQAMMERAELAHVERLHRMGRQLSVLRRMYEGYASLIERLLAPRAPTLASLRNSVAAAADTSLAASYADPRDAPPLDAPAAIGVSLSSAARVRFERLRGIIGLYAISEIEECERVKEGLVMMVSGCLVCRGSRNSLTVTELQLNRHQGVAVGRAPHPRHAAAGQAYLPLHACQRRHLVFRLPVCRRAVHGAVLLELVRGHGERLTGFAAGVQCAKWDHGCGYRVQGCQSEGCGVGELRR